MCDAILEEPVRIEIKGQVYFVAPPTAATLIEASKYLSQLPNMPEVGDEVVKALAHAHQCEFVAEVVATLMLGRKGLTTQRLWGLIPPADNRKRLVRTLLDELTWAEISDLGNAIIARLDIGFFLGFTTSLREINLLQQTRTTPSGQ